MDWKEFITAAFEEDIREGDHTSLSTIPEGQNGKAILWAKADGIVAGVELAQMIFWYYDSALDVKVFINDGAAIKSGDKILEVSGSERNILSCERLVLNCMQRMSGIATLTKKYVDAVAGTSAKILDTRKTTPLFRAAEKWAVKIGGGENHRFGLYDMILIKDNHVDYAGGIKPAIEKANFYLKENNLQIPIEIETRNLDEVKQVLATGNVNRVMLDNFTPELIREALNLIDKKIETEVSGGITLETIRAYAETGVDFISVGALTHSYTSLDLSLKAVK
ncbi:nicotinate-nucleotide diphosphorylase [Bacteroidota bacterium]|nr:nicotinate-nucleotide diphosphorylase [Bacteroidota bacterium]